MTIEAVNSMLKFLEEPESVIYAFLTTNNENNVLPTILSRCQILRLKTVKRDTVIKEAEEMNINPSDAELLSYFYNDPELIFAVMNPNDDIKKEEKEEYLESKESFVGLLNALDSGDYREAVYYVDKEIIPVVKSKETARFFIDMLTQAFEDLVNIKSNRDITLKSYATILNSLANKLPHINESLIEILKQRNLVNMNINISLQLDHLIIYITKEKL